MKDSEGWVFATCTQPNPRRRVQMGGCLLHVPSLILDDGFQDWLNYGAMYTCLDLVIKKKKMTLLGNLGGLACGLWWT